MGSMNPTGGNSSPNYPYFITTAPTVVKKLTVPKGTKLEYEEQFFKEGAQSKILNEAELVNMEFPAAQPILWGGVPVTAIRKFFNSEMRGYSVYADSDRLNGVPKTRFSQLWESCSSDLGISIRNSDDWSFNPRNIADVTSCSVNYQRYFKDDTAQQQFLNNIYSALLEVGSK